MVLDHSKWEKAKASILVRGRAVRKPAREVFFPESHETKLIKSAATSTFPIAIHINHPPNDNKPVSIIL